MIQELHILMGLPGSGKTYWAMKFKEEKNLGVCYPGCVGILHCDDGIPQKFPNWKYLVLDGIFTTLAEVKNAIIFVQNKFKVKKVIVHRWDEDIDACLWNDTGRRNINSAQTIKSMKIANLQVSDFDDMNIPVDLIAHQVIRKPEYLQLEIPKDICIENDQYIRSKEWTVGGQWHSWDGSRGNYSSEPPVDFVEFDNLLLSIDPKISYLIYKKLWKDCVTIKEENRSDYYSNVYVNYYQCDVKKLYEILKEYQVI